MCGGGKGSLSLRPPFPAFPLNLGAAKLSWTAGRRAGDRAEDTRELRPNLPAACLISQGVSSRWRQPWEPA